jgi:serine phosphatase RsbU (regulator of sigma subunit)
MLSVQIRYYNNSITRENALRIVILPPWWKTWWAQILFIILGAGIIWGLMQFRTRQLVKQKLQLEQIVKERTREIEEQKNLIEEKNRDILDSINYTRRLQRSSLPGEKDVKEIFSDSFILYMPRDIISGDFYFVSNIRTNDGKILRCAVAGDCTGHGVPGAFLSILLLAYIKQSMGERDVNSPAEALQFVTEKMKKVMEYRLEESLVKDSADMSFMVIYPDGRMIASCANNPIYIVRDNSLIEIPAVKRPVGYSENELPFENHEFITRPGDMIYMFSDGYADQFGLNESTKNKEKKFTKKRFKDLLIQISALPVAEQYNILLNKHQEWKGKLDQTDDILVIGIRI